MLEILQELAGLNPEQAGYTLPAQPTVPPMPVPAQTPQGGFGLLGSLLGGQRQPAQGFEGIPQPAEPTWRERISTILSPALMQIGAALMAPPAQRAAILGNLGSVVQAGQKTLADDRAYRAQLAAWQKVQNQANTAKYGKDLMYNTQTQQWGYPELGKPMGAEWQPYKPAEKQQPPTGYIDKNGNWVATPGTPHWEPKEPKPEKPTLLQGTNGELVAWQPGMPLEGLSKPTTGSLSPQAREQLLTGLANGSIVPSMLSKRGQDYNNVMSMAAERGLNLPKLENEYTGAKTFVKSLNGPQMTRFKGLGVSVVNTIDELKNLATQMDLSGISLLNQAELAALTKTAGNTPSGQLATKYIATVNTLREEFASLAMGGYAPTEPAFTLANKQINENFGAKQMAAGLDQVQRLINYRLNAFSELEPTTPSTGENKPNFLSPKTPPSPIQTPDQLPVGKGMVVNGQRIGRFPDGLYIIDTQGKKLGRYGQ